MNTEEIARKAAKTLGMYAAYANTIQQPLLNAAALASRLHAYQNALKPGSLHFIQAAVKSKSVWPESFVAQMTRFQRTADMFNLPESTYGATFIGKQLKAQPRWHRRIMGYADAKSLDDLIALSYELVAEPVLEIPESKIILLDEVARIKSAIKEIYRDNQIIYRLEPRYFEEMVAELLRKQDFKVELTKQTRDGGYDLIALQNISGFPYRFLVECKRYASHRPVGVNIIRSFCQVMSEEKNNGIIVISSYFSPEAKAYKTKFEPYNLHLRDRDDVLNWVNQ